MNLNKSLARKLNKYVTSFSNNIIVKTVTTGMARLLPVTIVGSICNLLVNIPWDPYLKFLSDTKISTFLGLGSTMTNDIISIYVVVALSMEMARILKKSRINAVMLSIVCFFIVTPRTSAIVGDSETLVFTLSNLGSRVCLLP